MKLDADTLHALGQFLDSHDAPVEERTVLCVIDGIHYRLDGGGCWRFIESLHEAGWNKCTPPAALERLF